MMTTGYTYADILEAYSKVGVSTGKLVMVHSDLGRLFNFENPNKNAVLDAHYLAFRELLGPSGTLVVITGGRKLCNTNIPFDLDSTPSWRCGVFSEYVRNLPGTLRSFNPFDSYSAIGPLASEITQNVSRHSTGLETPKARMIERDALCLSIGLPPNYTCSTVHHVEQLMAVPYRYTKEFMHPVIRNGQEKIEPFYIFVWYRECGIKELRYRGKDFNKKIFEAFEKKYQVREATIGEGKVYSYSMKEFYESTVQCFKEDIYVWLSAPPAPENRVYRR